MGHAAPCSGQKHESSSDKHEQREHAVEVNFTVNFQFAERQPTNFTVKRSENVLADEHNKFQKEHAWGGESIWVGHDDEKEPDD